MEFFSRCLISWSFTKYDKTKKHLHNTIYIHIDIRSISLWELLATYEEANVWGKRWERLRESWLTFEGKEFHFFMPAEILAYGTRAVSWPMFSPLSVTKWPSYHTIPSKFASNREILFCANEPQKRENASELGVKTWNLRPASIAIWCILCPSQALEPWGPCLRKCCNSL